LLSKAALIARNIVRIRLGKDRDFKLIRQFLANYMLEKINTMTTEEFEKFRESIRVLLEEKDYNLIGECNRYWDEILTHALLFDHQ
jgi:secreted Zn-dependent insulinase-like peptidase